MNVNGKYLKDESGNIISPVVSTDTSYHGTTKLSTIVNKCMTYTLLFSGNATGDITLPQSSTDFTILRIFYYVNMNDVQYRKSVDVSGVSNPNNTSVLLDAFISSSDTRQMFNAYRIIGITDQTIFNIRMGTWSIVNSESYSPYYAAGNNILPIYKIIGINIGK